MERNRFMTGNGIMTVYADTSRMHVSVYVVRISGGVEMKPVMFANLNGVLFRHARHWLKVFRRKVSSQMMRNFDREKLPVIWKILEAELPERRKGFNLVPGRSKHIYKTWMVLSSGRR